jgi:hypothetical protein
MKMKQLQTIDKHLQWLLDRKEFINISKIERELQMPEGTIQKFIDGRRNLPYTWHAPVIDWVKKFRK